MKKQKGYIDLSGLDGLFYLALIGLLAIVALFGWGIYELVMLAKDHFGLVSNHPI